MSEENILQNRKIPLILNNFVPFIDTNQATWMIDIQMVVERAVKYMDPGSAYDIVRDDDVDFFQKFNKLLSAPTGGIDERHVLLEETVLNPKSFKITVNMFFVLQWTIECVVDVRANNKVFWDG